MSTQPVLHILRIDARRLINVLAEMQAIMESEAQVPKPVTLSRKELDMIKGARKRFTKRTLRSTDSPQCAICMDTYKTNRRVLRLPCGHLFCFECIGRWLTTQSATCPTCRLALAE